MVFTETTLQLYGKHMHSTLFLFDHPTQNSLCKNVVLQSTVLAYSEILVLNPLYVATTIINLGTPLYLVLSNCVMAASSILLKLLAVSGRAF